MEREENIAGAYFYECEPESWQCLETCVSEDMQRGMLIDDLLIQNPFI